jgi:WD40 repeat protein
MTDSGTSHSPYVGPRALYYGEKIYGRDREARQLLDLLIAERIVLLYSPSGAGKTSLIQAALIPALQAEEFRVLPVVRVSRGVADGVGLGNPYVLSALLSLEQDVPPEEAIPRERLAAMQFGEFLDKHEKRSSNSEATVLIFDQFEEILTFDPLNRAAKADFFNQVGTALRDLRRWALFAIREDHVAGLDPYLRPIPTRLNSTFRLDLLNADSARLAVQKPAREQGVDFTEEATTKLVDDLRQVYVRGPTGALEQRLGPYVEPVQLQVVCYRLWEKLDANIKRITVEQVAGAGDVDSALADYYAERVRQIAEKTGVPERVIRDWFERQLITESGFRGQVMEGPEGSQALSNETIKELENVHLVRGEERRGVTWLELAHDRLVKPILADNAKWSKLNLSVLQHQAAIWQHQGRSDALCLSAEALDEARKWAAKHSDDLTDIERDFLEACQRNHDARQSKSLRRYLWASAVVLTCMLILAALALWQWNVATGERKKATASSIAFRALQLADERLDSALLLAAAAEEKSDLLDTRRGLLTVAYSNPRLITFLHDSQIESNPGTPVDATVFSPDGALLATGDYSGRMLLWDIADVHNANGLVDLAGLKQHGRPPEKFPKMPDAVRSIAFSPNGKYLAVSSKGGWIVMCERSNARDVGPQRFLPTPTPPPSEDNLGNIWCVTFSPDSALLASGDSYGRVLIWDVAQKALLASPQAQTPGGVRAIAFHSGAWPFSLTDFPNVSALITRLASGSDKPSAELWKRFPEAARAALTDPAKPPSVTAPLFIEALNNVGSGDSLAGNENFSEVALSDATRAAKSAEPPPGLTSRLNRLLIEDFLAPDVVKRPDPPMVLAAGCGDGSILLWKREGSEWSASSKDTSGSSTIMCMAFSPAGNYVAVGRANGNVELFELDEFGTKFKQLLAKGRHEGAVTGLAFSPDGLRLLTGGYDGTARLWKVPSMQPDGTPLTGHVGRVLAVAFNSDGRIAASAGMDRKTILWAAAQTAHQKRAEGGGSSVSERPEVGSFSMAFTADGIYEAEGYDDDSVLVTKHDRSKGASVTFRLTPAASPRGLMSRVAFSPDDHYLAFSTRDLTVRLHDLTQLPGQSVPPITFVDLSMNLLTREVALTAEKFSHWSKPKNAKITAVSVGGDLVAAAVEGDNAKAVILIWNARTGEALIDPPLECPDGEVIALQLSADGKRIASGGDAEKMRIWDLTTGSGDHFIDCPEVHTGKIRCIAFDPAGSVVATGSGDNTLILWKATDASQLCPPLTGHQAPVISAVFSHDGKLLASGSDDTAVMVWDVESMQPVGRLVGHTSKVKALAFSTDEKQLFSGSQGEETRTWQLDPKTLVGAARNRANRAMTKEERGVYIETK